MVEASSRFQFGNEEDVEVGSLSADFNVRISYTQEATAEFGSGLQQHFFGVEVGSASADFSISQAQRPMPLFQAFILTPKSLSLYSPSLFNI